jgi:adenylate kinase family enzyme
MRIHISGAPGSGKSTIGRWIKQYFKVSIVDIDRVFHKYIQMCEQNKSMSVNDFKNTIQESLYGIFDSFISTKPIVFIGLNYPDPRIEFRGREIFIEPFRINLNADVNIYIDIDPIECAKQKLKRELKMINVDELVENGREISFNPKDIIRETRHWRKTFIRRKYTMVHPNDLKSFMMKIIRTYRKYH